MSKSKDKKKPVFTFFEEKGSDVEFKAYSRKLLRDLKRVKELIVADNTKEAIELLDELIIETASDIEE